MKGIPVHDTTHRRCLLIKMRMDARTLDEVVTAALDALAEREHWTTESQGHHQTHTRGSDR